MTTASNSRADVADDAIRAAQLIGEVVGNAWATDATGRFIYVTPAALALLGMTLEELNAPSNDAAFAWRRLMHPDDHEGAAVAWRRSLQTGKPYNIECRMLRSRVVYGWSRCSGQPWRDSEGQITGWYGTIIDRDFAAGDHSPPQPAGMSDETAVHHSLSRVHPQDRPAAAQAAARAFWTGVPQVLRYRQAQSDGAYAWAETRVDPSYSVTVEINELVSEQEQPTLDPTGGGDAVQIALIIDSLFGNAMSFDAAGRYTYMTPFALSVLGVTLDDLNADLGDGHRGWKRIIHPDDYERTVSAWNYSQKTGDDYNIEHRVRRASGLYVWARSSARPLRDQDGRITGWFGTGFDVDVYKKTEEALRERQQELSQLVDLIPSHLWRLTADGEPTYFNKRMSEYLGLTVTNTDRPDVSRLRAVLEAIHPDDAAKFRDVLKRCLATGEHFSMRHRLRSSEGVYRWMSSSAEPLRDESGYIVQWYGISIDVDDEVCAQTELRRTQERLAQAGQAASLAELSASIAHEVNQPLAAVVANSHACQRWLLADPPNLGRAQTTIERIIRDANGAADVVSRVRALFKQNMTARTGSSLATIILEAKRWVSDLAMRNQVRVETRIDSSIPPVAIDEVQIQQVLINLMRNGVEAMETSPEAKILSVRARADGGVARIEVCDTGPGLEDPEKIFDAFFTTKEGGMGMGLAVSRSIAESHGGRLWAEQNNGGGAAFILTLPIEPPAPPAD